MLNSHTVQLNAQKARVVKRLGFSIVAAMAVVFGGAHAHASSLTPDLRATHPAMTELDRNGDFDGDGRRDTLYLVDEPETGRVAVHVRLDINGAPQDIRVTSLDMDVDSSLDLAVVHAGQYASDCGSFSTGCTGRITALHDSLMLNLGSGTSVLMHWQGDHFETDFVRNDEASMARALAALYAVNP